MKTSRTSNKAIKKFKMSTITPGISFAAVAASAKDSVTDAIMPPKPPTCGICLTETDNGLNICPDQSHEPFCRDCIGQYTSCAINDAFMGSCPVITCPSTFHIKKDGRRQFILPMEKWKTITEPELEARYKSLASSLLAFLCGGCHSLKTLDVGYEPNTTAPCYKALESILSAPRLNDLMTSIDQFCTGSTSVSEFYELLEKSYFPQMNVMPDKEAWDSIYSYLLKLIPEPERRANLHLRYLRDRPRMHTLCCNREHCFKCKIKDFHTGKTCTEYTESLDHSIVCCPSCGISLARGDGCNTITCVCGKQFSWSVEKENSQRCEQFLVAYPNDTTKECANLLCTLVDTSNEIAQAKAWQVRHRLEVNRALREWFREAYRPCPSQGYVLCQGRSVPGGLREAMELWRGAYSKEVEKRLREHDISVRQLFLDTYPCPQDRPVAAHKLSLQFRRDEELSSKKSISPHQQLVRSAIKWIESNREEYNAGMQAMEANSAKQFLYLYANRPFLSMKPCGRNNLISATSFDRGSSNSDLTYSNNDRTAERSGSVSCYPAAFARLPSDKSAFRVVIESAPRTSNWLTFGVARRGMANTSSDGVGRTANTWGLSDDRSSSSSNCVFSSSGTEKVQCRKLREGDILTAVIDTNAGWAEVSINDSEFKHMFEIPPGSIDDYFFAMTFANDHRVTIVNDPLSLASDSSNSASMGTLNEDHSFMFLSFKKQVKSLLEDNNDDEDEPTSPKPRKKTVSSLLLTSGAAWLSKCGGDKKVAEERFSAIRPALEKALCVANIDMDKAEVEKSLAGISSQTILESVCWFYHNRKDINEAIRSDRALSFHLIHGENAPFIAAMTMLEFQKTKKMTPEVELAQAYFLYFADEMDEWYDNDAKCTDPLIEGVPKTCRCLPRHVRSCPGSKAKKSHRGFRGKLSEFSASNRIRREQVVHSSMDEVA